MASLAVITGAGSGFGRALSEEFARRGIYVVVCDIDEASANETARLINGGSAQEEPRALSCRCDVTRSDQIQATLSKAKQFGASLAKIAQFVFVNNAGVTLQPSTELDSDKFKRVLEVNLTAVIDGTRLAIDFMRAEGLRGVILNVASAAGVWPQPMTPVYAASKAGVINFTRSMTLVENEGIRVVAVAPTFFDTPFITDFKSGIETAFKIMPIQSVVNAAFQVMFDNDAKGGSVLVVQPTGQFYWPPQRRAKL